MKCDYELLGEYRSELQEYFQYILYYFQEIKNSNDNIIDESNWQSDVADFYRDITNDMENNYNLTAEKMQNILDYLEHVIANYEALDFGFGIHIGM